MDLFGLLVIGVISSICFLGVIVPKFDRIFQQHDARLPPLTQGVLAASHVVTHPVGLVGVVLVLAVAARALGVLLRRRWTDGRDHDLERAITTLMAIVVVGGVWGSMVISLYLPIFKLTRCV
jgi:type II secretory pathway component PulF